MISQTLGEMLRVYLGFASVYGVPAYGFGLIIVAGLLGLYSWNLPSWQVRGVLILLALTILFIPFALNFISAFPRAFAVPHARRRARRDLVFCASGFYCAMALAPYE